jgi:hypothetical protein
MEQVKIKSNILGTHWSWARLIPQGVDIYGSLIVVVLIVFTMEKKGLTIAQVFWCN